MPHFLKPNPKMITEQHFQTARARKQWDRDLGATTDDDPKVGLSWTDGGDISIMETVTDEPLLDIRFHRHWCKLSREKKVTLVRHLLDILTGSLDPRIQVAADATTRREQQP